MQVLTVNRSMPSTALDRILTATEEALLALGASRIWIDTNAAPLSVMAQFADVPEPAAPAGQVLTMGTSRAHATGLGG